MFFLCFLCALFSGQQDIDAGGPFASPLIALAFLGRKTTFEERKEIENNKKKMAMMMMMMMMMMMKLMIMGDKVM